MLFAKMATSTVDPRPLCFYYARQGFARLIVSTVDDSVKRRGPDGSLLFWKALALSREGACHQDEKEGRS